MNQKGFTLIEVLIAIVLLAIISVLLWQSLGGAIASKERFDKREGTFRGASILLDRMTNDLASAVLYNNVDMLGVSPSGEQSSKSVLIGTNDGDHDKLTFNTLSHIRYLKNSKESDLSEVTYFLEPEEEDPGLFEIRKREKSPLDASPGENGTVQTLLEGVKELNFRFYDATKIEFKDEWDTTKVDFANRLPRSVEITLVMQDPIDEEAVLRFKTVAFLEAFPGPNDF